MENSTEWAYAVLEPALLADEKVTLGFIKQIDKAELEAIAYCFEEIVSKFRSKQIVEAT